MRLDDVGQVLDGLTGAGVRWWVAGGWGVDALVGRETRDHRDLDLLVDIDDFATCLGLLDALGYVAETDWMPIRLELAAPGERWVDTHPVRFDETGYGVQAGPDGTRFDYPPDVFTVGSLGGRDIPCLTAAKQRDAHSGYETRPQDLHDLRLLDLLADGRVP